MFHVPSHKKISKICMFCTHNTSRQTFQTCCHPFLRDPIHIQCIYVCIDTLFLLQQQRINIRSTDNGINFVFRSQKVEDTKIVDNWWSHYTCKWNIHQLSAISYPPLLAIWPLPFYVLLWKNRRLVKFEGLYIKFKKHRVLYILYYNFYINSISSVGFSGKWI